MHDPEPIATPHTVNLHPFVLLCLQTLNKDVHALQIWPESYYTVYYIVYLVISLPKIPYTHGSG